MTVSIRFRRLDAARQPTEMPRNAASSTMLVKNVRNTTVLPNQRMQASSRNRMRKLTRNRSPVRRKDSSGMGEVRGLYPRTSSAARVKRGAPTSLKGSRRSMLESLITSMLVAL